MIESFRGRVQTELLDRRRHTALGMPTPIEYELRHARIAPVA
jgi:putative transposase